MADTTPFRVLRVRALCFARPDGLRQRTAFTLVELLVVLAVIGVLLALLLPAVQAARESARRATCANNLRQIGIALHDYHAACATFPPGCTDRMKKANKPDKWLAWSTWILPFLEQENVYRLYDINLRYDDSQNHEAVSQVLPVYLCPSTSRLASDRQGNTSRNGRACTDYGGMFGHKLPNVIATNNGVMIWEQAISLAKIHDGASNTIVVTEDSGRGSTWDGEWANGENIFDQHTRPNTNQDNEMWSDHPGGVQILLCDGAVRFLRETVDQAVLRALCTRAGRDVVDGAALD